jgi:hypothetical protein
MWEYKNGFLVNTKGRVLDVSVRNLNDRENSNVVVHRKHGKLNQQFDIVYVDEMPAEPKKGELNKDFNLIVERPFYVVSQLGSGKYLDMLGRNMVIKTRNGKNTQLWYFDQRTRTVKNF